VCDTWYSHFSAKSDVLAATDRLRQLGDSLAGTGPAAAEPAAETPEPIVRPVPPQLLDLSPPFTPAAWFHSARSASATRTAAEAGSTELASVPSATRKRPKREPTATAELKRLVGALASPSPAASPGVVAEVAALEAAPSVGVELPAAADSMAVDMADSLDTAAALEMPSLGPPSLVLGDAPFAAASEETPEFQPAAAAAKPADGAADTLAVDVAAAAAADVAVEEAALLALADGLEPEVAAAGSPPAEAPPPAAVPGCAPAAMPADELGAAVAPSLAAPSEESATPTLPARPAPPAPPARQPTTAPTPVPDDSQRPRSFDRYVVFSVDRTTAPETGEPQKVCNPNVPEQHWKHARRLTGRARDARAEWWWQTLVLFQERSQTQSVVHLRQDWLRTIVKAGAPCDGAD